MEHVPAGLLRRLGAMVSDTLVVVGLLLLGTLPFLPLMSALGVQTMTIADVGWAWGLFYWLWRLLLWVGFFVYFWSRSGQTVGMRAWRIKVVAADGSLLTRSHAFQRFGLALVPWLPSVVMLAIADHTASVALKQVGLGLMSLGMLGLSVMFIDPNRNSWHDRLSQSKIILLPKL